ncbi:hypothetical protein G6O69_20285 [Pseudenhygromyxa sp. WMMC2535]|uniref:hypothetical protein n=1 Tax=Pseudenhygromyxa sp. WMMC2535 TaxID=2712867 RepID=UPI001594FFEB|nr:hypothetical protein [Pseudenhygromyxa sp. WMMC2535]NVB40197.1 hypothetical protein [Pseudenhygromyxa sp. WMMC2535]
MRRRVSKRKASAPPPLEPVEPAKPAKPVEIARLRVPPKTLVLMRDPPERNDEFFGAPPLNIHTMFWARCVVDGRRERTTRNPNAVRKFLRREAGLLDADQLRVLALTICKLSRLGDLVGGPSCREDFAEKVFGLTPQRLTPSLLDGHLGFHTLSRAFYGDLLQTLHEYRLDLGSGDLRCVEVTRPWAS